MRFLLNMNVPRDLGRRVAAKGHTCRHVGDIGMAQATDVAIIEQARANHEIIVTHDLDYGHLLAFSDEGTVPSVIIIRMRNTHPNSLFARILSALPEIEPPLLDGAIVVLEDANLRVRRLSVAQEE